MEIKEPTPKPSENPATIFLQTYDENPQAGLFEMIFYNRKQTKNRKTISHNFKQIALQKHLLHAFIKRTIKKK